MQLHDGLPVDQVREQVGDPLAPCAAVVRLEIVVMGAAARMVKAIGHVHGVVRELVEDDPPALRVVLAERRVAVEADHVHIHAVCCRMGTDVVVVPHAFVVLPYDGQVCARLQPEPPEERPAVGYGVNYAGCA